jgi:hypothetical protein
MSFEVTLSDALEVLVSSRVWPDVAPAGVQMPYITYQQVGGTPVNFLSQAVPSKKNARVQVNGWAANRLEAAALGIAIEDALRVVAGLQVTVLTGVVATHEPETGKYGTRQDFSVWF